MNTNNEQEYSKAWGIDPTPLVGGEAKPTGDPFADEFNREDSIQEAQWDGLMPNERKAALESGVHPDQQMQDNYDARLSGNTDTKKPPYKPLYKPEPHADIRALTPAQQAVKVKQDKQFNDIMKKRQ